MSRAEQITASRRRRNTEGLAGFRRRLSIDESKLDTENFTYRWVNDAPGRIHSLTVQDDWEVVSDRDSDLKEGNSAMGANVSVVAGVGDRGAPVSAVLLRKPKAYHDADYSAQQRQIDEMERGLKSGKVPGAATDGSEYTPKPISIGHGDRQ